MLTLGKPIISFNQNEFEAVKGKLMKWLEKARKEADQQQQSINNEQQSQSSQPEQTQNDGVPKMVNQFVLTDKETIETPSGMKIIKAYVKGQEQPLFARSEKAINQIINVQKGSSFVGETREENGFAFLEGVQVKNAS